MSTQTSELVTPALIAAIVQALLKDDDFWAGLAKFVEGEMIATLEVTDIVGEERVASIERRINELERLT